MSSLEMGSSGTVKGVRGLQPAATTRQDHKKSGAPKGIRREAQVSRKANQADPTAT